MLKAAIFLSPLKKFINTPKTRLFFLAQENSKENFRATISAISWNINNFKKTFKRRSLLKKITKIYKHLENVGVNY